MLRTVFGVRIIQILVLMACWIFSVSVRGDGANTLFSEEEVRAHVKEYIAVVFGGREPTLADYYKFSGLDESEYELELKECVRRWGSSIINRNGSKVLDDRCRRWIETRDLQPLNSKSLYYSAIRNAVQLQPELAVIKTIERPIQLQEPYKIIVHAPTTGVILELYHAATPNTSDFGLVGISKINGRKIDEVMN